MMVGNRIGINYRDMDEDGDRDGVRDEEGGRDGDRGKDEDEHEDGDRNGDKDRNRDRNRDRIRNRDASCLVGARFQGWPVLHTGRLEVGWAGGGGC
ncbi:hypothetical protein CIB84_010036 [Bambusicola thoracicus]|uniref:Uncharacterized protein n=1 Tax=Bambusicola thoracicus TaxID=9083 RepID=A0A2P4SQ26_BAMTH|nr:hypothetical protein CIB84_010036 [Bambusicola thoracicus]